MTTYDLEILIRTKKTGDDPSPPPDSGFKWTELASKVSLAKQAFNQVAQVAKFAYENIKAGAELEAARGRFENLAGTINTTADALLGKLRDATNGMVSDANLIAGASDIISLGLAKNEGDTVRLATAVSTLGLDMQQVILTFANNSKARLDSLGLSVEGVTQKAAELEAQGFKGDAFDEAVLIGLEQKMTLLGDASETTAGSLQILESSWANYTNSLKQGVAESLAPTIKGLADKRQNIDWLREAYADGILTYREYQKAVSGINVQERDAIEVMAELGVVLDEQGNIIGTITEDGIKLTAQMEKETGQVEGATAAYVQHDATLRAVNRAMLEFGGSTIGMTTRELEEMAYANGDATSTTEQLQDGIDRAIDSIEEEGVVVGQTAEEIAASRAELAALAAQTGDLFTAFSETDGALKFFNEDLDSLGEQYVTVGGRTAAQNEDLGRLQDTYDKAAQTVRDYELGIKGANLTDEERAEKIAEQQVLMTGLQESMAPLLGISGELVSVNNQLSVNQDAVNNAMIAAADAAGADAGQIALLKVATGELTPVQAEAVIKSVALEQTLKNLGEQYATGELTLGGYMQAAQQAVTDINEMTVSFDTQTGTIETNNAKAAELIDTLGRLPTHHDFIIKITQDGEIPTIPGGPQGKNAAAARALGGPFGAGELYRVGEGNLPEIGMLQSSGKLFMIPGERGQVFGNGQAQQMLGGFTDNSQISIVNNNLEAAATTNALIQERRRARLDSYMGVS